MPCMHNIIIAMTHYNIIQFTFATNIAMIISDTLVSQEIQMTGIVIFVYSFLMTVRHHIMCESSVGPSSMHKQSQT